MIGIYDDDGNRLPMAYNGLTINNDAYPVDTVVVNPRWDATTEPMPQQDGMEAYAPRRLSTLIRVDGMVKASSVAQLHDRIESLTVAFDPVRATTENPATYDAGFLPFTFSVPTENTAVHAGGLIPMQYNARSIALPVDRVSKYEGDSVPFSIILQAADPRRYYQSSRAHTMTALSDVVDNSVATYESWPVVRVTMSGVGATYWHIDNPGDLKNGLALDLSSLGNGQQIDIDMRRHTIKQVDNGANRMDLYLGGEFLSLVPGTQTIEIHNTTGIASVVLTWTWAFV
jgi:hypothetical protein